MTQTPEGTSLVWLVVRELQEGDQVVGLYTDEQLARDHASTDPIDLAVIPQLLMSRPVRRVDVVRRNVSMSHCAAGWWVRSDRTWIETDQAESDWPLSHGQVHIEVHNESGMVIWGSVSAEVAGRERKGELIRAVQAALDEHWPDRLPGNPEAVVIA